MAPPLSPYQRRLFIFLSVATFFEGYDFMALSQILPNLRADMGLSEAQGGWLVSVIGIGTVAAYGLVRLADRLGRRRVLMITILGYASFTFLSGLSRGPYDFAAFQLIARIFLIAEWALAMVIAAEEFPADRRGFAIGIIQACTALGSIVCAAVVPLLLVTPFGWRSVYFVGVLPLLVLAYARRNLKETGRFAAHREHAATTRAKLFDTLRSPRRNRVFQLAVIWGLTYMCTQNAVVFWKEFAVAERGFTDGQVGSAIAIASLVSLPLVFMVGKLLDGWGRKAGAALIYLVLAGCVFGAYQLHGYWPLTAALTGAIFGVAALPAVLNTFTTELFPTAMRGDAYAWSNNLLGRIGYIVAPVIVAAAAETIGWGAAVSGTAVFAVAALGLVLWLLPETRGRELEETATA
ncbi:MAG TPA: MFS transporter [Gemmatimonadales bacterium]